MKSNRKISFFKKISIFFLFKWYQIKYYFPYAFVHKPLCLKYKKETFCFFNKIYICRSCFFFYTSIFLAFLLARFIEFKMSYLIFIALFTVIFSYPGIYKNYSRKTRDLLRFFLGFSICTILIKLFLFNKLYFVLLFAALFFIKQFYNQFRKRNDLCSNCEKLNFTKTCEGYLKQKNALLEIEEKISNYIMKTTTGVLYD